MTQRQALDFLRSYWGTDEANPVSASVVAQAEAAFAEKFGRQAAEKATLLEQISTLAGMYFTIKAIQPFDYRAVFMAVSRFQFALEIREATQYRR